MGNATSTMPKRNQDTGPDRNLEVLQKAPLGTDQTEGLQDLIEAILEYEANHSPRGGGCSI